MPKTKEVKFHSSKFDSVWLPSRMYERMLPGLIELDQEPFHWPGQDGDKSAYVSIYISSPPEGKGSYLTAGEFYIISYHDLDDDNGPYRLYTAFTLEQATKIRNDIREVVDKAVVAYYSKT